MVCHRALALWLQAAHTKEAIVLQIHTTWIVIVHLCNNQSAITRALSSNWLLHSCTIQPLQPAVNFKFSKICGGRGGVCMYNNVCVYVCVRVCVCVCGMGVLL